MQFNSIGILQKNISAPAISIHFLIIYQSNTKTIAFVIPFFLCSRGFSSHTIKTEIESVFNFSLIWAIPARAFNNARWRRHFHHWIIILLLLLQKTRHPCCRKIIPARENRPLCTTRITFWLLCEAFASLDHTTTAVEYHTVELFTTSWNAWNLNLFVLLLMFCYNIVDPGNPPDMIFYQMANVDRFI